VLDFLGGRDHHGGPDCILFGLADHVVAFRDQVLHVHAFLAARRQLEHLKHLFEAVDVPSV
jgi:hypothetical protein